MRNEEKVINCHKKLNRKMSAKDLFSLTDSEVLKFLTKSSTVAAMKVSSIHYDSEAM